MTQSNFNSNFLPILMAAYPISLKSNISWEVTDIFSWAAFERTELNLTWVDLFLNLFYTIYFNYKFTAKTLFHGMTIVWEIVLHLITLIAQKSICCVMLANMEVNFLLLTQIFKRWLENRILNNFLQKNFQSDRSVRRTFASLPPPYVLDPYKYS